MIAPVWKERALYRTRVEEYDQALLDIREAISKAESGQFGPPEPLKDDPWEKYRVKTPKTEHGPWENYAKKTSAETREVQIPASAINLIRPDKKDPERGDVIISFPGDPGEMKAEDILRVIQRNLLISRPTFSLRAAIRSHPLSSIAGTLLFLFGLLISILFAWPAFKRKTTVSVNIPNA
jgi:hypothetical protein